MEEKPKKKISKKVWIPVVVLALLAVLFVPVRKLLEKLYPHTQTQ